MKVGKLTNESGVLVGGLAAMTQARVRCMIRIVFSFWLVVLIAPALTTIVTLLPLPDQGQGLKKAGRNGWPLANSDVRTQYLLYAEHQANPATPIATQCLPGALSRQDCTIPHTFSCNLPCSVSRSLQYLASTFNRITKGDCPWLLRLTSTVLTVPYVALVPTLTFKDLQPPQFGICVAFPMVERKTLC